MEKIIYLLAVITGLVGLALEVLAARDSRNRGRSVHRTGVKFR